MIFIYANQTHEIQQFFFEKIKIKNYLTGGNLWYASKKLDELSHTMSNRVTESVVIFEFSLPRERKEFISIIDNICTLIIVKRSNNCQIWADIFSHMQIFPSVRSWKNLHFSHEFHLNCILQNQVRSKTVKTFPTQIMAKLPEKPYQLQLFTKST